MAFTRTTLDRQMDHAAVLAHGAHPRYRVEFDAEVDTGTETKQTVNLGIKQGSVVYLDSDTGKYNLGLAAASGQNFPVPIISLKNAFDADVTTGNQGYSPLATIVVSSVTYYKTPVLDTAIGAQAYFGWRGTTGTVFYTQVEEPVAGTDKAYTITGGSADAGTTITTVTGLQSVDYRKSTYSAVGGKITGIPCTAGYEIETTEFVAGQYKVNDALTTPTGAPGDTVANRGKLTKATQAPFKASGSQPILGFVSRVPYENKAYIQNRIGFWTNFIPAVGA